MITAHLPSGYVLARSGRLTGAMMAAAMIGAVWPDLDLFFFYLVDDRAIHHHRYWVHTPGLALVLSALIYGALRLWRPGAAPLALAFGAGWMLHLLLDGIVGGIMWLWPFSDRLYVMAEVPARYDHWVMSFILHWSFGLELLVWAVAGSLLWRRRG